MKKYTDEEIRYMRDKVYDQKISDKEWNEECGKKWREDIVWLVEQFDKIKNK